MTTPTSYDSKTIFYHWISVLLILTLWILGQNIDNFSKGDPRVIARSIHITLGVLLTVVYVLRIKWKFTAAQKLPQATPGAAGKLAIGVHHLLYLILGLILILGIAAVWIRGDNIFNLFRVPAFPTTDKELPETVTDIHGLLANALLVLAAGHALMAIWHQLILKDGVLKRVWPSLK